MLVELYIDALLVDEGMADQVWELWDVGLIPDDLAAQAWCILALEYKSTVILYESNYGPDLD